MKEKEDAKPRAVEARPPRVLLPELAAHGAGEEVPLKKEEAAHLRARRLKDGDEVILLDGRGGQGRGAIASKGRAVRVATFEEGPGLVFPSAPSVFASLPGEPRLRVTVLLACAEPARVEWAVEKGTECGAAGFVLVEAARSQRAHVAAMRTRLSRLSRIAAEATKQCDRTIVPAIEEPRTPEDFLRRWTGRVVVAQPGAPELSRAAIPRFGCVALAIGPEGGFDPSEVSLFEESGALLFSLGPRVLRLETAVVAALTVLVGGR
jgi:16S rRNA (uracil1498-N3)-methyltransferase